jgi:GNAT superfamily N-acetyltransferase
MLVLREVEKEPLVSISRELFLQYEKEINVNLCFQNFNAEVAGLPGEYSRPSGRLMLIYDDETIQGCVALRKIGQEICEMKRLYLKPISRGKGLGRIIVKFLIDEARSIGYHKMRLDTLPQMKEAIALYRSLGFKEINPYRNNPVAGALFFELEIRKQD